jgi:long-subunit fatty acid transport protein
MNRKVLFGVAAALTSIASAVHAQGSLSLQGFGYPPGELSTRALGTGGAFGDIDPRSPINPAAMAIRSTAQIFAQYDPEFRRVTAGGATASTTTARLPNVGGVLPVNDKFVIGFSAATFLDRTWETSIGRSQVLGADTVSSTERLKSAGAITDVRIALAYSPSSRIHLGVAYHAFPGSMQLTSNELFPDSTQYQNITQISEVSFSGSALSAGAEFEPIPSVSIALSGRKGGKIRMFANDSLLTTATIPDRYSGSIAFSGIPGTTVAVRAQHERWSQLSSLSTVGTRAVDANDISAGVESSGPRLGGFPLLLRLGARQRTLPFELGTASIKETSFGAGLGVPIAYDRVTLDIAAFRTNRTGVPAVTEHAYNLSFGLQVHP